MEAERKPRITTEGRTPLQDVIPLDTPYLVFLDPSDKCNSRCGFCPSGNRKLLKSVGRVPQLMDFDLYRKIIDDLCEMPEKIKTLRLYKDGEPLLNRKFPKMVEYAWNTMMFGQIDTTSNGKLLTPVLSREIVEAGLDKIFISIPQSWGGEYRDRIFHLYELAKRRGCNVHVKIIGDGLTEKQINEFYYAFSFVSDSISVEHIAPCWPGMKVEGVNPDVGIYGQPIKEVNCCPYVFYSLAINSDGTVSLCFLDWKHQMIIGDLRKQSFREIWNSNLLRGYQIMHLAVGWKMIWGCTECQQLRYGAPDNIDAYAQDILRRIT